MVNVFGFTDKEVHQMVVDAAVYLSSLKGRRESLEASMEESVAFCRSLEEVRRRDSDKCGNYLVGVA